MAEMKNLTINGTPFTLPFAPAGYGLGQTASRYVSMADADAGLPSGLYAIEETMNVAGLQSGYWLLEVKCYQNARRVIQFLYPLVVTAAVTSNNWGVYAIRTDRNGSGFDPWSVENPPMALGVEYRTTERWNGKVVYRKAMALGALPNTSRGHYRWYIDKNATIIRSTMYARKRTSEGTITSGDEQYNGNVFFDLANNSIMACATPWTNGSDWYLDIRSGRDLTYLTDTWGEMAYVKE